MIPDGACQFTRGMGMSCNWDSERGFGERSWRYSMVVDDCKIEKIFIENGNVVQNFGPDPFEVSDADSMVAYLESVSKKRKHEGGEEDGDDDDDGDDDAEEDGDDE